MSSDWTWADVKDQVEPAVDTVPLVLDRRSAVEIEQARRALVEARKADDSLDGSDVVAAEEHLAALEAHAPVRDFTVRSVGHRRWRELVEAHPGREGERWNAETFIPAVLLEACDQFTSEADVDHALEVLTTGQVAKLFAKIRVLNEGDDEVPTVRGR